MGVIIMHWPEACLSTLVCEGMEKCVTEPSDRITWNSHLY